jgi:hypothetical protein
MSKISLAIMVIRNEVAVGFLSMKQEIRYGCPVADQILFNRFMSLCVLVISGKQSGHWMQKTRY